MQSKTLEELLIHSVITQTCIREHPRANTLMKLMETLTEPLIRLIPTSIGFPTKLILTLDLIKKLVTIMLVITNINLATLPTITVETMLPPTSTNKNGSIGTTAEIQCNMDTGKPLMQIITTTSRPDKI